MLGCLGAALVLLLALASSARASKVVSKRSTSASRYTSAALPSGGAVFAWVAARPHGHGGGRSRLRARFVDAHGRLSKVLTVGRSEKGPHIWNNISVPGLAVAPNGTVGIGWAGRNDRSMHLALLRDERIVTRSDIPVPEEAIPGRPIPCATGDGDFDVFWRDADLINIYTIMHARVDAVGNVGPVQRLDQGGVWPGEAARSGEHSCTFAWDTLAGSTSSVKAATVPESGVADAPVTLDQAPRGDYGGVGHAVAAAAGQRARFVWDARSADATEIRTAAVDGGGVATSPSTIAAESGFSESLSLTDLGGEQTALAWVHTPPQSALSRVEGRVIGSAGDAGPVVAISRYGNVTNYPGYDGGPSVAAGRPRMATWTSRKGKVRVARWHRHGAELAQHRFGTGKRPSVVADAASGTNYLGWLEQVPRRHGRPLGKLRLAVLHRHG